MKRNEAKKIVREALISRYGFAPALKYITLLEASSDRNNVYIAFQVYKHKYKFRSHHRYGVDGFDYGVWVGKDTITHCDD